MGVRQGRLLESDPLRIAAWEEAVFPILSIIILSFPDFYGEAELRLGGFCGKRCKASRWEQEMKVCHLISKPRCDAVRTAPGAPRCARNQPACLELACGWARLRKHLACSG